MDWSSGLHRGAGRLNGFPIPRFDPAPYLSGVALSGQARADHREDSAVRRYGIHRTFASVAAAAVMRAEAYARLEHALSRLG